MEQKTLKIYTKPLPFHRGNARLWIETPILKNSKIGETLRYEYRKEEGAIVLVPVSSKGRKVTVKKNGTPVIDINNGDITSFFKGVDKISIKIGKHSIVIEPSKESLNRRKARAKLYDHSRHISFIDLFSGGGTMSKSLANGSEGIMRPVAAVELEDKYLSVYEKNHKDTLTYCSSIDEVDLDLLPDADVVCAGIPCECYSVSGKKEGISGRTGHLGYYFLEITRKVRPALCLVENTPLFKNSEMRDLIVFVLSSMGYNIYEDILSADRFGGMTKRKRYILVASISDLEYRFPRPDLNRKKCVGDILEKPIDEREWLTPQNNRTIAYSVEKEKKHIAAGHGFRLGRVSVSDTVVPTITKDYAKQRLTDPILIHPEIENCFSWFTPRELARLNGLDDSYVLPVKGNGETNKTVASQCIGQGVDGKLFSLIGRSILDHFIEAKNSLPISA